jgi:hypothetical protein
MTSLNFEFLQSQWPQLAELGGMAEQFAYSAANLSHENARLHRADVGLYVSTSPVLPSRQGRHRSTFWK